MFSIRAAHHLYFVVVDAGIAVVEEGHRRMRAVVEAGGNHRHIGEAEERRTRCTVVVED